MSRYVTRDVQSVKGKNPRLIEETVNLDHWTISSNKLRNALIVQETVEVPAMDRWRLPYLCSLLSQRRAAQNQAMEEEETRLDELIDSLVLN